MAINIRYIVEDVGDAIAFYRDHLGFELEMHPAPGFAALTKEGAHLYLNAAGAGGGGTAGGDPEPGGWNRLQIAVTDLDSIEERLRSDGIEFRGDRVIGRGGDQILVEDPSGNPVEIFQPK